MEFIRSLIWAKLTHPSLSPDLFSSKTVLVTGCSGLATCLARELVRKGASTVILACRDQDLGNATKKQIQEELKLDKIEIKIEKVDMESFESVERLAKALPALDIAIMNAGVLTDRFEKSNDGWEKTLQVNALSTTLLASRILEQNRYVRMILVGSQLHTGATLPSQNVFDTLNKPGLNPLVLYGKTKLVQMLLTEKLAEKYLDAIVITCCPGCLRTNLWALYNKGWKKAIFALINWMAVSPEKGSTFVLDATYRLCMWSEAAYWKNGRFARKSSLITPQNVERVWQEFEEKVLRKAV